MRSRSAVISVPAVFTVLIYFGQVVLAALHFLSVDHGVVTRDGAVGHGTRDAHRTCGSAHARHDAHGEAALLEEKAAARQDKCGFPAFLARSPVGIQGLNIIGAVAGSLHSPRAAPDADAVSSVTRILFLAPKHSPPTTA